MVGVWLCLLRATGNISITLRAHPYVEESLPDNTDLVWSAVSYTGGEASDCVA